MRIDIIHWLKLKAQSKEQLVEQMVQQIDQLFK